VTELEVLAGDYKRKLRAGRQRMLAYMKLCQWY
jgi:hypothetical protein